ncbi:MAG: cytochrome b/b6 domain-containing protein [Methylophaga sp.]|nr:cytochrome b/b6 domain-containing protein [Methylophaga sp.]
MSDKPMQAYPVWDLSTRIFHWVAVLSFIVLTAIGLVMMFSDPIGVTDSGKIVLKTAHSWAGYVFVINLLWRFVWAFAGNRFARWGAILPFGKVYKTQMDAYRQGRKIGRQVKFLGHNPLARWSILVMLVLMTAQSGTGLILASTDIYAAPFGTQMKQWVAADKSKLDLIKPYDKTNIDPVAYKEMREFRKPFRVLHTWLFYLLTLSVVIHIAAVVRAENLERSGLTSAMFSGEKHFHDKPFDAD